MTPRLESSGAALFRSQTLTLETTLLSALAY